MDLTLRLEKGYPLTYAEGDNNFLYLSSSIIQLSSSIADTYLSRNGGIIIGNLVVTGSIMASSLTGSLQGTSSYASNSTSASYAATASYANNFTVAGTLTAQTIIAQTVTSSIDYITGSTKFGSLLTNIHQITGSLNITGSLSLNDSYVVTSNQTSSMTVASSSWSNNSISSSFTLNSTSASYATSTTSASYALNATSASYVSNTTSASYALNATSASYVSNTVSSSYAATASYVANASSFPYTGSAIITGSLSISSSTIFNTVGTLPATSFVNFVSKTGQNGLSIWDNGAVLIGPNSTLDLPITAGYGLYVDPGYDLGLYAGKVNTKKVIINDGAGIIQLNNTSGRIEFQLGNKNSSIQMNSTTGHIEIIGGSGYGNNYGVVLSNQNNGTGLTMFGNLNVAIGTTVDSGYKLDVSGSGVSGSMRVQGNLNITGSSTFSSSVTASSFNKSGGTSSQYLMADGSVSTVPIITSGTYTPTLTYDTGDLVSGSVTTALYTRVGNIVTVTGIIYGVASSPSSGTGIRNYSYYLSLPITQTNTSQRGTGVLQGNVTSGIGVDGGRASQFTTNQMYLEMMALYAFSGGNLSWNYTFSYEVE